MDINKITTGKNPPEEVNVIIEVSKGSIPVKYEMDKDSGALFVDRIIQTSMFYPCNYGFVPHTLSLDGDPIDILVIEDLSIMPGSVIAVRPVAVLNMEDESGIDEKILAVPTTKINPSYKNINSLDDIPTILIDRITNFFENYKKLEPGKWVKLKNWEGADQAKKLIKEAIERYKQ